MANTITDTLLGTISEGPGGNVIPPLPDGWQPGDVAICWIATQDPNSIISMPLGWQEIAPNKSLGGSGASIGTTAGFLRVLQAGDTDPLVTSPGVTGISAIIIAFRGIDQANPIDALGSVITTTSTPFFTSSLTTKSYDTILIMFAADFQAQGIFSSWNLGLNQKVNIPMASRPSLGIADVILTNPSTVTGSVSVTGSDPRGNAFLIALRPAQTVLFLHNAKSPYAPTAGTKSAVLPVGGYVGPSPANAESDSLDQAIGSNPVAFSVPAGLGQVAHQDNYLARFTSPPLKPQTIAAGTWVAGLLFEDANALRAVNSYLVSSIYVWRPGSSSVVGYIYDSDSPIGRVMAAAAGRTATVPGSSVVVQAGDVLVFEVWRHAVQADAQITTVSSDGDSTPRTTEGSTDFGSYLQAPQVLLFADESIAIISAPDLTDEFEPIDCELGFIQAPLAADVDTSIPGIALPDESMLVFPDPIDDEVGWDDWPLAADVALSDQQGMNEIPDMALYQFDPIEDELGFQKSVPPADVAEGLQGSIARTELPDMNLYQFDPIENELGFQWSLQPIPIDESIANKVLEDESLSFYALLPIEDELGFQRDAIQSETEELFGGRFEWPTDLGLYSFEPIEDELGFQRSTPAGTVEELFGSNCSLDMDLYQFEPIKDEEGFEQSPLSDDIEELLGEWEFPDDFDLYDFEPIRDEIGVEQAPLAPDIEEIFQGEEEWPTDLDLYSFEPIEDEQGYLQAPLSDDLVEAAPSSDFYFEDFPEPIKDELGFEQSPLSDDVEELFGSRENPDLDLYQFEPIEDEQGFYQSPLSDDIEELLGEWEFPDDFDLYDFEPIRDEIGVEQAPLSDDVEELFGAREIPDTDLYGFEPIEDEQGFYQTPLSDDVEEIFGSRFEWPTDFDLYSFEPIRDEIGVEQAPLSDDVEEIFGSRFEWPTDLDLYGFEPVRDEIGVEQSPLSDDIEEIFSGEEEWPTDLDLYSFEPIRDEIGFEQAPLADDIEEIFGSRFEWPTDLDLYGFDPIRDEIGFEQPPLSDDVEELFGSRENPDMDLYGFDPIEDEQGFYQSPLAPDIEELFGALENPDMTLYGFEPIRDEIGFEQSPLADDIEELLGEWDFPDDLDLYSFEPIRHELGFEQAPLSDDVEELFGSNSSLDITLYDFEPIEDEIGYLQTPRPGDVLFINVSDSGSGIEDIFVERFGPKPGSSGGSGGGDGDGRWWGKHYEDRAWEWIRKPKDEGPRVVTDEEETVESTVQTRLLEFLERKIAELVSTMSDLEKKRSADVFSAEDQGMYVKLETFLATLQGTAATLRAEMEIMNKLRGEVADIASAQAALGQKFQDQVKIVVGQAHPLGQLPPAEPTDKAEKFLIVAALTYAAQDVLGPPLNKVSGQLSALFALKGAMLLFERWLK